MEQILDFVRAAAPWVTVGVLTAIFAVMSAARRKSGKKSAGDYGTEGMCLGMSFGAALGCALGNNTGIGLSFGMLAGLTVGMCVPKKEEGKDR